MKMIAGVKMAQTRTVTRMRTVVILTGALSLFLIILFGILQYNDIRANRITVSAIEASNQRQRLLSDYLDVLQDIETGQRGYVLTGNPDFLQPEESAQRRAGTIEQQLMEGPHDDGAGRRIANLITVGRAKQQWTQRVIRLRRDAGEAAAARLIAGGYGKRLMDEARDLVAALAQAENDLAQQLFLSSSAARNSQQDRIILAEVALILTIGGLLVAMARTIGALRTSSQALADSASRQAAIFAAANDSMMILDERGTVTSVNPAAERLFGRRLVDMIGRSNRALFAEPPSEAVSIAYLRAIAREDGSVDASQTFVGKRDDGSVFETEVVTTPVILHDTRHFLAVARDATERRRVERLKAEFVATISHELRTPLTSIAGSLGLLAGGAAGVLPDKAARLLAIAQSNSQRLIRLINDILDIEKIEAGKMVFVPQPLDVRTTLERAIHDSDGLATERQVCLRMETIDGTPMIHADPDRMGQVLANLLSNAIKYSPVGGVVTVSSKRQNLTQRISIADRGSGIPDEFRDRIFQKFAQADSTDTRQVGGTGLGLSIVHELVTRMGGEVSFDSVPGGGTVFHLDLPALAEVSSAIDTAALEAPADPTVRRLLHVDDDPDTLRLVASALEGHFDVRSSPSVREAEAALHRMQFHLVILDIALTDGSGVDLIPVVQASCGGCPVILYTAYDVEPEVAAQVDAVRTKTRDGLAELVDLANRLGAPLTKEDG